MSWIAAADLDAAGREFEAHYGLSSVAGGRHPGWGTANRIGVLLGDTYLELVRCGRSRTRPPAAISGRWVAAAHKRPAAGLGRAHAEHST